MSNITRIVLLLMAGHFYLAKSQSFYNPQIYSLDKKVGPYLFKILKVSHDSAYLYCYERYSNIKLVNLSTGKILRELKIPHLLPGMDYDYKNYFVTDKGIEFIDIEENNDLVTLKKKRLSNDLKIIETGQEKVFEFKLKNGFNHTNFSIRKNGSFYEAVFMNGCIRGIGKFNRHYFELLTMDENFVVLDRYVYDGKESDHILSICPDDDYSNGIAYQLFIDYDKQDTQKQIIITTNSQGKISAVNTARLNSHFNFTRIKSSGDLEFGYCYKLITTEKHEWALSMDKYQLDRVNKNIIIIARDLFVKNFSFDGITELCTKSIVENNRVKLLAYVIDRDVFSTSWNLCNAVMGQATYFEFNEDTLTFKYNLPFHFATGRNVLWGGMDLFMGQGEEGKIFIAGTDDPEATDPANEEAFEKMPMVNTDKLNYSPIFYRVVEAGGANKNALKDPTENEFYTGFVKPNNGYKTANGNFYFPFWIKKPHVKTYIVKFAGKTE